MDPSEKNALESGASSFAGRPFAKPSLGDLNAFNAELAALVRAGVPLEGQLRRLGRELPGKSGQLAERVGARLESGQGLEEAIQAEGEALPEVYRAVVAAGLRSGRLGAALEATVDSAERLQGLRRALGTALLYPLLLVALTWGLLFFACSWILPKFAWFEPASGGPFTDWLGMNRAVALALAVLATLTLFAVAWWWRSTASANSQQARTHGWNPSGWLPWIGAARYYGNVATFSEVSRLLIANDVPLSEALAVGARTIPNSELQSAALQLSEQTTVGEIALAEPLANKFPPILRMAFRSGGDRQRLAAGLERASQSYRRQAERAATTAANFWPLLLTACVGGTLVFSLMLVVLWPYIGMLNKLAGVDWW